MRGLGYERYLDMIEDLDLDAVSVNQVLYLLGWRRWIVPRLAFYTDEWGVRSKLAGELLPVPVGRPVRSMDDLERFVPPRPARNPVLRAVRYVRRRAPERAVVMLSRNDFAASWFLCGMDDLLISYIDAPEFADALAALVGAYYAELFSLAVAAGVDVVVLTDDYAFKTGTLMSRPQFERFVLPWLRRGVRAVHDAGGLCVKHTDGEVSGILDLIVDTGVDAIGPLEPAAGMDLLDVRRSFENVALVGNVDVDLLSRGTTSEVAAVTAELVRGLGRGHVLSSGNTIASSVKPENFLSMIESGRAASL